MTMRVDVVIPALNEEASISTVVRSIPRHLVRTVVVADNGSTDGTADAAREAGAAVVREPRRGYGSACLAALAALGPDCDVVAFLDGDGSDAPECLAILLDPILRGEADFVVGSRVLGECEPGALTPQQRIGNAIASNWLRVRFRLPATDLGPFRAIRKDCLDRLAMTERTYGWTVEMQIKAAWVGIATMEVPVSYRRRIGVSKISGTVRGTVLAGLTILRIIVKFRHVSAP